MNQKVLLILSILIISTFAESERIAGGDVALLGRFQYHVKIEPSSGSFRRLCGGALIKYNWVITVAQCIYNARDVIVRLGVVDRLTGPEGAIFWVQDRNHIIVHGDFTNDTIDTNFGKDIGLIYLKEATEDILTITIEGIRVINTIPLPPSDNISFIDQFGIVTGFGFYLDGEEALQSMKLRYATMRSISYQNCKDQHQTLNITADNFCTDTTNGQSTCTGDEGGPFVTAINGASTLVGLASTAFHQCTVGQSAVFTNLVTFFDWIEDIITEPPFITTTTEQPMTTEQPTTTEQPVTPPDNGRCICECHCITCPPQTITPFWKND